MLKILSIPQHIRVIRSFTRTKDELYTSTYLYSISLYIYVYIKYTKNKYIHRDKTREPIRVQKNTKDKNIIIFLMCYANYMQEKTYTTQELRWSQTEASCPQLYND